MVLLDNGRSGMIGSEFQDILRCIRCGACMNHCPVYLATGGHAYGWVYPGPMGAVLTPSFIGIEQAQPPAERLDLLRPLRAGLPGADPAAQDDAPLARAGVRQGALARRSGATAPGSGRSSPSGRRSTTWARASRSRLLGRLGRRAGRFRRLPLAGGWTGSRDLPAPQGADLPGPVARAGAAVVSDDARDAVLDRLRRALGRGARYRARCAGAVQARLAHPQPT